MIRYVTGCIALVLALSSSGVWAASPMQGQAACSPAALAEVEEYVKVSAPAAVIRRRVNECGIAFALDKTTEDRLTALGASAEVMTALRSAKSAVPVVKPGTVVITSRPTGAKVLIDGQDRGATPLTLTNLSFGPHQLKLARDGYTETSADVVVKTGETVKLDRTLARVPVVTPPPPAKPLPEAKPPVQSGTVAGHVPSPSAKRGNSMKWPGLGMIGGGVALAGLAAGGPLGKWEDGYDNCVSFLSSNPIYGSAADCASYYKKQPNWPIVGGGVGVAATGVMMLLLGGHGGPAPSIRWTPVEKSFHMTLNLGAPAIIRRRSDAQ